MSGTGKGALTAAVLGGFMMMTGIASAAPAISDPALGDRAPLVEQAQLYFGVPGVGLGVGGPYYGPGPYYGRGPYYGPRRYYGSRRYYGPRRCRIRYTPYGPRRVCWQAGRAQSQERTREQNAGRFPERTGCLPASRDRRDKKPLALGDTLSESCVKRNITRTVLLACLLRVAKMAKIDPQADFDAEPVRICTIEEAGLKLEAAETLLDVSDSTVQRYEAGEVAPRQPAIRLMYQAIGERQVRGDKLSGFRFTDLSAGISGLRLGFESIGRR